MYTLNTLRYLTADCQRKQFQNIRFSNVLEKFLYSSPKANKSNELQRIIHYWKNDCEMMKVNPSRWTKKNVIWWSGWRRWKETMKKMKSEWLGKRSRKTDYCTTMTSRPRRSENGYSRERKKNDHCVEVASRQWVAEIHFPRTRPGGPAGMITAFGNSSVVTDRLLTRTPESKRLLQ